MHKQWPPPAVFEVYDVDKLVSTCLNASGVDPNIIAEFELTEDMEHLPNSREVKLYFRCYFDEMEYLTVGGNKILFDKLGELFNRATHEQQKTYISWGKGCTKRTKSIKDPVEFAYELMVCWKVNGKEVKKTWVKRWDHEFYCCFSIICRASTYSTKLNRHTFRAVLQNIITNYIHLY